MAIKVVLIWQAIFNGFNTKENCIYFLKRQVEIEKENETALVEEVREEQEVTKQREEMIIMTVSEIHDEFEDLYAAVDNMVGRNTGNAKESSKIAEDMHQVSGFCDVLNHAMEEINTLLVELGQNNEEVVSIASQTNLLALNASIEAARAGEAGRGFAVVADNVRQLAEKTMAATHEVGEAIKNIQDGVHKNITGVNHAGELTNKVTESVNQSGSLLEEILHLADSSADQVRAIAAASEEQSASSESINRSVEAVNTISNQTAQAMRSATGAVNDLSAQARELMGLIEEMKRG